MAFLALGFRPFYLLAGCYAALAVPIHVLQFTGLLPRPEPLWHPHEMLFGYAFAVITGFLFTAVRNWTGRPTPSGATLGAIAGLWLAARILAFWSLPAGAALDAAFACAVAWGIGRPLVASGNRRNLFFVALVLLLGAASVAFTLYPAQSLRVGMDAVLFIMTVIAGRVVPSFTNNAVRAGAKSLGWLERASIGSLPLLFAASFAGFDAAAGAIALAAAALHAARLLLWRPWKTLGRPILWILHASYAWIVAHLVLRGLADLGLVSASLATHALTAGAIGGLTLGMMTRTARGHTGREIAAGPAEVAAYGLVLAAGAVRVFGPLAFPAGYVAFIELSAVLWSAAFAVFAVSYAPMLVHPRLDGRPG
jgi:uncharacterized protein involved in response to NO